MDNYLDPNTNLPSITQFKYTYGNDLKKATPIYGITMQLANILFQKIEDYDEEKLPERSNPLEFQNYKQIIANKSGYDYGGMKILNIYTGVIQVPGGMGIENWQLNYHLSFSPKKDFGKLYNDIHLTVRRNLDTQNDNEGAARSWIYQLYKLDKEYMWKFVSLTNNNTATAADLGNITVYQPFTDVLLTKILNVLPKIDVKMFKHKTDDLYVLGLNNDPTENNAWTNFKTLKERKDFYSTSIQSFINNELMFDWRTQDNLNYFNGANENALPMFRIQFDKYGVKDFVYSYSAADKSKGLQNAHLINNNIVQNNWEQTFAYIKQENISIAQGIITSLIKAGIISGKTNKDVEIASKNKPPAFGCTQPVKVMDNYSDQHASFLMYSYSNLFKTEGSFQKVLRVRFLDTSKKDLNDKVFKIATKWEEFCTNIKFQDVTVYPPNLDNKGLPQSDIRIDYNPSYGSFSYVGRANEIIPQDQRTMNFGWFYDVIDPSDEEFNRTTLHEFGHALGFFHELQNPYDQVPWDEQKVIDYYSDQFTEQEVMMNILDRLDKSPYYKTLEGTKKLDTKSIMCYRINQNLLKDEFKFKFPTNGLNNQLSYNDRYYARQAYHIDLKYFPVKSKITVKLFNEIIKQFNIVQRSDIDRNMPMYAGQPGIVFAVHPVNGVQVIFEQFGNATAWFEPECLEPESKEETKENSKNPTTQRFYQGTVVQFDDKRLLQGGKFTGKVKTTPPIQFYNDKDAYSTVCIDIGTPEDVYQPIAKLTKVTFLNKGVTQLTYTDQDLSGFSLNQKVIVLSRDKVINSFEYADRNDFDARYELAIGQKGTIIELNLTNGIYVNFENGNKLWFEPGGLAKTGQPEKIIYPIKVAYRFLINSLIIVTNLDHSMKGQTGNIVYPTDADGSKIQAVIETQKYTFDYSDIQLYSTYLESLNPQRAENPKENIPEERALTYNMVVQNDEDVALMQSASTSNEEDFMKGMASKLFGITSDKLVLLPLPTGAQLTLTKDVYENYRELYGAFSGTPQNSSLVPFADIFQQIKEIYALATTDSQPVTEEDRKLFIEYNQKILDQMEQLQFFQDKYIANPVAIYKSQMKTIEQFVAMRQQEQREILNKYGSAALSFLANEFANKVETDAKAYPKNIADMFNDPVANAKSYGKVSYSHTFSSYNNSTSSVKYQTSASYSPFFKLSVDGTHTKEDLSETFKSMSFEANCLTGYFERPWLSESLFGLKNLAVNSKEKGTYSNGELLNSKLDGLLSIIPRTYIIVKDLKVTVMNRNKSSQSSLDDVKASTKIGWGPFSFNASTQVKITKSQGQETANEITFTNEGPMLFGAICQKMPLFPVKDGPGVPSVQKNFFAGLIKPKLFDILRKIEWTQISITIWEFVSPQKTEPRIRIDTTTEYIYVENKQANDSYFEQLRTAKYDVYSSRAVNEGGVKSPFLSVLSQLRDKLNKPINDPEDSVRSYLKTAKYSKDQMDSIAKFLKQNIWKQDDVETKKYQLVIPGVIFLQITIASSVKDMTLFVKKIMPDNVDEEDENIKKEYLARNLIANTSIYWNEINAITVKDLKTQATMLTNFLLDLDDQQ